MSIRPGQVVGFKYNKGTNPGSVRIVHVTGVDGNHVKGNDLTLPEGEQYRQFLMSEMQDKPRHIANENETVIPLASLVRGDVSGLDEKRGAELFRLLKPDLKLVVYNDMFQAFVVKRGDLPRIEIHMTAEKTTLSFVNEEGKPLAVSFRNDDTATNLSIPYRRDCQFGGNVANKFAMDLAAHMKSNAVDGSNPAATAKCSGHIPTASEGWSDFYKRQSTAGNPLYANKAQ